MPIGTSPHRQRVERARQRALEAKRTRRTKRAEYAVSYAELGDDGLDSNVVWWLIIGVVLLAVSYVKSILQMAEAWETDPNYSHGYLVPLVSGFFAYRAYKRHGLPTRGEVSSGEFMLGAVELTIGLLLHTLASFANSSMLDGMALVGILHGGLVMCGGLEGARPYGCAILYLMFMAPIPIFIYQPVAIHMQDVVAAASTGGLKFLQLHAWREGYIVHCEGYTMEVGQACSGLRQITAFLALSVAAAHLSDRRKWYKWALVLMAVPTAVAANCFRVALTGVVMMLFGQEYAEGIWHTMEGLAVFIVGVGLYLFIAWGLMVLDERLLARQAGEKGEGEAAEATAAAGQDDASAGNKASRRSERLEDNIRRRLAAAN